MTVIIRTKCCHLPMLCASNEKSVVYFDCSWARKEMLSDNVELQNMLQENGILNLYHIADEFCEEVWCIKLGSCSVVPNVLFLLFCLYASGSLNVL